MLSFTTEPQLQNCHKNMVEDWLSQYSMELLSSASVMIIDMPLLYQVNRISPWTRAVMSKAFFRQASDLKNKAMAVISILQDQSPQTKQYVAQIPQTWDNSTVCPPGG